MTCRRAHLLVLAAAAAGAAAALAPAAPASAAQLEMAHGPGTGGELAWQWRPAAQVETGASLREPVDRVAIFDCARFAAQQNQSGPPYVQALLQAFVLPPGVSTPRIGTWDCKFHPGPPGRWRRRSITCTPLAGAPMRFGGAQRVILEFQVIGDCASFTFGGRPWLQRGPGVRAVMLDRNDAVLWNITTTAQRPGERWGGWFQVALAPLVNARP